MPLSLTLMFISFDVITFRFNYSKIANNLIKTLSLLIYMFGLTLDVPDAVRERWVDVRKVGAENHSCGVFQ